jgi:hypothetical protein
MFTETVWEGRFDAFSGGEGETEHNHRLREKLSGGLTKGTDTKKNPLITLWNPSHYILCVEEKKKKGITCGAKETRR